MAIYMHGAKSHYISLVYNTYPPRHNLRDLMHMERDDDKNAQRNFWRWIERQEWRQMLPTPFEYFSSIHMQNIYGMHANELHMLNVLPIVVAAHLLRVDVVLEDPSREKKHYIDSWHMFLPSESDPWLNYALKHACMCTHVWHCILF